MPEGVDRPDLTAESRVELVMTRFSNFLRCSLLSAVLSTVLLPGTTDAQSVHRKPFWNGELLQYKVKWSFLRLGTVTIRQTQIDRSDPSTYVVEMHVRSADGLPFINVHFINRTVLSHGDPSLRRETIISGKDSSAKTDYFRLEGGTVVMVDSAGGKMVKADTLTGQPPCYDALGLFMTSRMISGAPCSVSLPTINDYVISPTDLAVTPAIEELQVDAVCRGVRCRLIEGNAGWEGTSFAGMSGAFRGWISDDEAAVPLRAEVKIFLGSIVLELESYRREGWGCGHFQEHQTPVTITRSQP